MIYLDNAATTKPSKEAVAALNLCLTDYYGNPSSLHKAGLDAEKQVTSARKSIAEALGVPYERIFFTSGATESNNIALRGIASANKRTKNKIVVSAVEHPSVSNTLSALEKDGWEIVKIKPENGVISASDFVDAVDEKTAVVSCMLVNNENGALLPAAQIFDGVKRKVPDIVTHCDAVQGFCKIPFRANALNADIITVSGHKVHSVKGIGAVYIKNGIRINPIVFGGGQENGIRSGTEAVPLIASFGAAVKCDIENINENYKHIQSLSEYALEKISQIDGIELNVPESRSPYIINISVIGYRSEILLHFLESKDIMISSGSACSKGKKSNILSLFGATDSQGDSALRISFSKYTLKEEIDKLINALILGINTLSH